MDSLASTIQSLRERRGLTQEQLADYAVVSTGTIASLEQGQRTTLYASTAKKLATAFRSVLPFTDAELAAFSRFSGLSSDSLSQPSLSPVVSQAVASRVFGKPAGPESADVLALRQSIDRLLAVVDATYLRGVLDSLFISITMGQPLSSVPSVPSVPSLPDRFVKLTKPPVQHDGYFEQTTQYFGTADKSAATPAQVSKPKAPKRKAR